MSSDEKAESLNNSPLGDGGIAVIADDFTGAAELAGISLSFGLTVELCVDEVKYKNADVLVVSTDSRSLNKETALQKAEDVIKDVLQLQPSFVYKKIDSVLRGYVVDELKLQMQLMDKQRAIVMPANPTLGRTIKNGEYFINGVKINETSFANDPEFPVRSSLVSEILKNEVEVIKVNEELPKEGIVVGEVDKQEDYNAWVEKLDGNWVLAGAGDFFTALLSKKYAAVKLPEPQLQKPFLYVCGTAFNERKAAIKKIQEAKQCVCYLKNDNGETVLNSAIEIIKNKQQLILAFDDEIIFSATAPELRSRMAAITKQLIEKAAVRELFIEGGSTAAAILQELNIKMLEPVNELSRGVVRMKSENLFITVKPGSYELPVEIKRLFTI
jgi:D-threonate/D-erythronate kinase